MERCFVTFVGNRNQTAIHCPATTDMEMGQPIEWNVVDITPLNIGDQFSILVVIKNCIKLYVTPVILVN